MSRHTALYPPGFPPPLARYSPAVLVEGPARWLVCSGQLGLTAAGQIPADAYEQTRLCFQQIGALLAAAGLTPGHVVRLNAYVTAREHLAAYMRARDEFTAQVNPPPASTLLIVAGFSRPEFLVEVEALAAAPAAAP